MTVHALSHLAHFLHDFKVLAAINPFAANADWHQPNGTQTSGFPPFTCSACSKYEAAHWGPVRQQLHARARQMTGRWIQLRRRRYQPCRPPLSPSEH